VTLFPSSAATFSRNPTINYLEGVFFNLARNNHGIQIYDILIKQVKNKGSPFVA
jgi:hypothetical protein